MDSNRKNKSKSKKQATKQESPVNAASNGIPAKKRKMDSQDFSDLETVYAAYCYLKENGNYYRRRTWNNFIQKYLENTDPMVKWFCCQCVGIITGMNENALNKFLNITLTPQVNDECTIEFYTQWEDKRTPKIDIFNAVNEEQTEYVSISGINLPIFDKKSATNIPDLVEVPSTVNNLRKIALGIASKKAICLQGLVGSGKTSFVHYLAAKTGRVLGESFVKIQLGDQTDSKMLLGTYRCTDIPGEFIWQPGVLTQAVMQGSWLLLEDVDLASVDIASVLSSLLENGYLTVPGYRDMLPISPGFQLFLTQRLITTSTGHHRKQTNASTLLDKHVLQIHIEPLSNEELEQIIQTLHPSLKTICKRIVNVFSLFSASNLKPLSQTRSRLTSTRDLFKWCSRAVIDFDVASQSSALKVLQDGLDLFCCSYGNVDERLSLAIKISTNLGIINEKAEYFCMRYKPILSLTEHFLKAGRASINREQTIYSKTVNFCFTRPAACLLERVMCCVMSKEPVLLVGETGTGKTSSVQFLAHTIGQKLIVINMNQQSDSADLLGGFKPVDMKYIIAPIKAEFEEVFCSYFNVEQNRKFLKNLSLCFNTQKWDYLLKLMYKSYEAALNRLKNNESVEKTPGKNKKHEKFVQMWANVGQKLQRLEVQLKHKNSLAFSFIEGSLVKAIENGHWVLLDEINLASAETLECLSGLLEGTEGSLSLLERGDKKPVKRHPKFTLFACMNPSTDVGKKDLQAGLRNRFTEFFVDELTEKSDLLMLVNSYLKSMALKEIKLENIVNFYLSVRKEAVTSLSDGLGQKPHFSLRSLCRALMIAAKNPCGTFIRSLYEAFCLSFLTQLDTKSYEAVEKMIAKYTVGSAKELNAVLKQPIPEPKDDRNKKFLQFEGYWIPCGNMEPNTPDDYILTNSVRKNLKDLARVVSIGKLPVLLQGDTSVGKTSLITYLAKASGNKCVRINNHEHTDLQEYVGSYVADVNGKLVFREGLLVQAMREGHWIILDELNLAPTDVLEALNRVLDDNRELFIPETQETVKANPNFMLFATQNPPGSYGGRKMLSRAFRNRFVELHFMEIPPEELEFILHKRCHMAPSYAKKMINVMRDLQTRRRGSAAFAGKYGFITLRDLFRWGERYRLAENVNKLYDWDQHIADEGYLVLAGRVRKPEERAEIAEVLNKHMKRRVDPDNLFILSEKTSTVTRHLLEKIYQNKDKHRNIVWTYNMRQLAVLVSKALEFKEPVLLVGETGGGKTTVCKLIADNNGQELVTVNCHMNTESSDFLGGLRPVREHTGEDVNKLFEWVDGPLVSAMEKGDLFLADEISLADDSVLERLNSLLEPERTLLLAEKGADLNSINNSETLVAHNNFFFIGTMNPGGDFGKKELSPALRNRFTEIWCESCTKRDDLVAIIEQNIKSGVSLGNQEDGSTGIGKTIMDFVEWLRTTDIGKRFTISIRDILTWVQFINATCDKLDIIEAYVHGACLTFLDSLGSGVTSSESTSSLNSFKNDCLKFFSTKLRLPSIDFPLFATDEQIMKVNVTRTNTQFGIKPFYIETLANSEDCDFSFETPTTTYNALRLLRGLQLNKAILLEGSPGVGKTSIVTALAKRTGNKLFRVNLSDQTDISDLFGADLPVEGGQAGQFAWRDGPLLQAMKKGQWILLDELNLASQSVLEGLNACLDHRGEIFIPELGKTFIVTPGTKFFGCQNPLKQGGSRRGLPQSFLNRFTQVYIHSMTSADLTSILQKAFNKMPQEIVEKMVAFNDKITSELDKHTFGSRGSPWECNLRDLTRWCEATLYEYENNIAENKTYKPENLIQLIYSDRMRTKEDKDAVEGIYKSIFGSPVCGKRVIPYITQTEVHMGDAILKRELNNCNYNVLKQDSSYLLLRYQYQVLRSLIYCVNLNWMSILVGSSDTGKSTVVKTLASLTGKTLYTLPVTSAMDTTDILGGFEQVDYTRYLEEIVKKTETIFFKNIQNLLLNKQIQRSKILELLNTWEECVSFIRQHESSENLQEETKMFLEKINKVKEACEYSMKICKNVFTQELKDVIIQINKIIENIEEEGSLNAGGKFEWVDSVLVKCLNEGAWLLIDNVNLCSPAVLDRLNALLEPNGTLIIGERGVDKNGQMVEVKPHKNFRLFLTMDPKNGEISRAMRNRGIEIFMLNDGVPFCSFDTKSLVNHQGLKDNTLIEKLIKVVFNNEKLCGPLDDKFNDLLQCSFLISQQLKHGISPKNAFKYTLFDLYHKNSSNKTVCSGDLLVLEQEIDKLFEEDLNSDLFSKEFTHSTEILQSSSTVANIKQSTAVLRLFVDKHLLQGSFRHEFKQLVQFLLVHSITTSNFNQIPFRHNMLKLILEKDFIETTNNLIENVISFFKKHSMLNQIQNSLPIEANWLPDTNYMKKQHTSILNKLTILLYFVSRKDLFELKEDSVRNKSAKIHTILQYLTSVKNKEFEHKCDDIVLLNCLQLLEYFDAFLIQNIFMNPKLIADYNQTIQIISFLEWRFYLYNFLKENIIQLKTPAFKDVLSNLHIHYKWFVKYSMQFIKNIFAKESFLDEDNLEEAVSKINKTLLHKFSTLQKIGKKFRKNSNAPPPLINDMQVKYLPIINELVNQYNVCSSPKEFEKIVAVVLKRDLRNDVINLQNNCDYEWSDLPDGFTQLQATLKNVKENVVSSNLEDVKFLPLQDYISLINLHKQKHKLHLIEDNLLKNVVTVPTSLVSLIMKNKTANDSRLDHEIKSELFLYKSSAISLNSFEKFLNYGNNVDLTASEDNEEKTVYMLHNPVLAYMLSNLLISKNNSQNLIAITQFGKYRQAEILHTRIASMLWKNIYQITNSNYDYIYYEKQFAKEEFKKFVFTLSQSLGLPEAQEDNLEDTVKNCMEKIEFFYTNESDNQQSEKSLLLNLVSKCLQSYSLMMSEEKLSSELTILNTLSSVYVYTNYLKALLHSKIQSIDPLAKVNLKKKYCLQQKEMLKNMNLSYELQNEVFSNNKKTLHPFCEFIDKKIVDVEMQENKLEKYIAVRPENVKYNEVYQVVLHGFSTVLSPNKITELLNNVETNISTLLKAIETNCKDLVDLDACNIALNLSKSNQFSFKTYLNSLSKYRTSYPDVVESIFSDLTQLQYGLNMKSSVLSKCINVYKNQVQGEMDVERSLINLVKLPTLDDNQSSVINSVISYTNPNVKKFLDSNLISETNTNLNKIEGFRLLKCGIQEMYNHCLIDLKYSEVMDNQLFEAFNGLIRTFVIEWNKQQEELDAKKQEEESLYKTKLKCEHKTEEQEIEEEFKKLFPNFHDQDFSDMKPDVLEDTPEDEINTNGGTFTGVITYEDVKFVSNLHSEFLKLCTKSEWLNPGSSHSNVNILEPLLQKYKLFVLLLNKFGTSISYKLDSEIMSSLSVLASIARKFGDLSHLEPLGSPTKSPKQKRHFDFYRDSNIEEIKSSYHILENLKIKIDELLKEWPNHPTLNSIVTIVERLYNFDITSPISRFLTGFEILLGKCHEWEQNAHSGVSIMEHNQNITAQIITWRKMELNMWKDSLNFAFDKANEPIAKWWFYMYGIMDLFTKETKITSQELVENIEKFIVQSNLAEFENRLNLLYIFHCHAVHLGSDERTTIFVNVLWNMYVYFSQFLTNIQIKIKEQRMPIEKKLKDYVKIVRWKDVSYWAIKETLIKTQKTLHKYMREFDAVLKQPVSPYLVNTTSSEINSEHVGIWDRPQRQSVKTYHYSMDSTAYMAKKSLVSKSTPDVPAQGLLMKSEKYFMKSRTICKNTIDSVKYPQYIKSLDSFVTMVIETSTHLQNLEVDRTLTKEKQKSQAKNILQQKHRALADLFSNLTKLGLSYRAGIIDSKLRNNAEDFLLKPLDLNAALSHLDHTKNDEMIRIIWEGCENYYVKSLMRLDVLQTALQNPAKDLGVQNIERCKGFALTLFTSAREQRTAITKSFRNLYFLRHYTKVFNEFINNSQFIKRDVLYEVTKILKNTITVMQQYKIILNAVPEESLTSDELLADIPVLSCTKAGFIKTKYDLVWSKCFNEVNQVINICEKILANIRKRKTTVPTFFNKVVKFNYVPVNDLSVLQQDLSEVQFKLSLLLDTFDDMSMSNSVKWLIREIKKVDFSSQECDDDYKQISVDTVTRHAQDLVTNILLNIQGVYKKYESKTVPTTNEEEEDKDDEKIEENHLKTLVLHELNDDLSKLEMKHVLNKTIRIASLISGLNPNDCQEVKNLVNTFLPLLEQIVLLHQYFITQQVLTYRTTCKMTSILTNIFIELATKGFCVPPELSDEKDGEGESNQQSGGMGLGDGEGEKDISERIESEDQLEDAHQAGQEKKQDEDKDCKEEDKGIEMSDDFDSKLQDVQDKEKDDDDESNNDSDGEEQMGETEEGADQLDQQIWGSDDEEPEEDESGKEQKEEKGDKGETEGEQQMGAKDGAAPQNDDDDEEANNESKEEKKEKKKDINEMDEPEFDDEQVDPYHGNQPELPEPEPMDLPDDLQLDDGQEKDETNEEENPFDIDTMKEQCAQEEQPPEEENKKDETTEDDKQDGDNESSDDEADVNPNSDEKMDTEEAEDNVEEEPEEDMSDRYKENPEKIEEEKEEDNNAKESSSLDQTQSMQSEAQAMDVEDTECADNVEANTTKDNKASQMNNEVSQEDNPDKEGVGQSQMEESKTGHKGKANAQQESNSMEDEVKEEKKRKPGETDSQRALGDVNEPVKKKMKTVDMNNEQDNQEEADDEGVDKNNDAEMYKHIKEAKFTDEQVLDSATSEQAEQQKDEISKMEEDDKEATESKDKLPEEDEDEKVDEDLPEIKQQKAEKLETDKKKKKNDKGQHPEGDTEGIEEVEIEGDVVQTANVARGETTYHTALQDMSYDRMDIGDNNEWNDTCIDIIPSSAEEEAWQKITANTSSLAQNLAEQLRLVLEPTQASRLKGDFKTGRRINMRKVIPYIASQFRKDKIWLRRTKPAKREYQIVLAIDDSSSMADNHSKELAFASVALISKALSILESGQLSVLSFGEDTEIVHKLSDTFSDRSGAKIMQKFQFQQTKTCIGKLVDFSTNMLNASYKHTNAIVSKLLVIVSDGRGIFSEGENFVRQAVRKAKFSNIFMVFVIIDNPENTNSILDIRMPVFQDGKLLGIKSYMDAFPFPFYIILRDIDTLPNVLSDALRQWFEIVSNTSV